MRYRLKWKFFSSPASHSVDTDDFYSIRAKMDALLVKNELEKFELLCFEVISSSPR